MFFHACIQLLITRGEIWSVGRTCQHLPTPNVAPDFEYHDYDDKLHFSGAKWHDAQTFLIVHGEQSAPVSCKMRTKIGHWASHHWTRDDQARGQLDRRTWHEWFSEHHDCAVQFWARHSTFCRFSRVSSGGWWLLWPLNRLDAIEEWIVSMFPKPQMGAGKKYTHESLIIDAHVWNPLGANLSYLHAVGKCAVNPCWRDTGFCSNCHAWNTVGAFKDRFHFIQVAFIWSRCCSSPARDIICLFPTVLNGIYLPANSFLRRNM